MKNVLLVLLLLLSPLSSYGFIITSRVTTVTGSGNLANRQLEASIAGNAMGIWTESSFNTEVQAAYFDGTRWFPPVTIANGSFPQVGVPVNGMAHAVWVNTSNTTSSFIYTARFNPSTNSWTAPFLLVRTGFNVAPQIAVNSQGNAIAVWIRSNPTAVQAATFNAATSSWSGPFTLITGPVTSPQVTLDDFNKGIVMWAGINLGIEAVTVTVP